jgi:hypothetical protein
MNLAFLFDVLISGVLLGSLLVRWICDRHAWPHERFMNEQPLKHDVKQRLQLLTLIHRVAKIPTGSSGKELAELAGEKDGPLIG